MIVTGATEPDTPPSRAPWRSYATLTIVMLLWAGNSIVGRAIRADVPPFTLALVRWTGAALIILPFAWRHLARDRAVMLQHWRPLLILGLTGVGAFNALLYSGLRYTTATNGLLMQAAIPAAVLLFNRIGVGVRAGRMEVVGVAISTMGVLYVVAGGVPRSILARTFNVGDLLILCGVACWAAYTVILRFRPECSPLSFLLATFIIGIVTMAPLAATEADRIATIPLRGTVLAAFAYVAVLPSLVAYMLYIRAVRDLGAAAAGQTISLMPLFGSLLAVLLLGERLHAYHLWGMAAILAGIVISAMRTGSQHRSSGRMPRARQL
ncbi:MAG: DMT family transporter [Sphingobium sp.]